VETKLRTDNRLFEALWDHSPIPQAIVSTTGVFHETNQAWSELLGYSRLELTGRHFADITHPGDVEADRAEVKSLLDDPRETGYSMVQRYLSKQGSVVWVELHVFAIRGMDSHLEYFAVCAIPLPSILPENQVSIKDNGYSKFVAAVGGAFRNNPRECIVIFILALVAVGKIPFSTVVDSIKHFLTP